ncbi:molybdopterin adenylyltransferase [Chloroflexota bacterium]
MFTVGILTISDKGSKGEREDKSGDVIREVVSQLNASVIDYAVIPDEKDLIAEILVEWADDEKADVIITTGGTGLSRRDVTPEATLAVVDKLAPGFVEAMRSESLKKTPHALLSRAVAGIRHNTLIINMPGSPKAVRECLEVILPALPHAVETLRGSAQDCAEPDFEVAEGAS